jgi:hypothetical protein
VCNVRTRRLHARRPKARGIHRVVDGKTFNLDLEIRLNNSRINTERSRRESASGVRDGKPSMSLQ